MSCKICGRSACIEFFHSIEEQERYEKCEKLTQKYSEIQLAQYVLELEDEILGLKRELDQLREEISNIQWNKG